MKNKQVPEEIKPCPFCGGEAEIKLSGQKKLTIKCSVCRIEYTQRWLRQDEQWLRANMIKKWNQRIPSAPNPASLPAEPSTPETKDNPATGLGGGGEGISIHDNLMKVLNEVENAHLGHDHEKCFKAIWQYCNNAINQLATLRQPVGTVYEKDILRAYYAGFNQAHYSHLHPDVCPPKECESAGLEYLEKVKKPIQFLPEREGAVRFAEWKEKNYGYLFFKDGRWHSTATGADETFTTEQLYQTFLQSTGEGINE